MELEDVGNHEFGHYGLWERTPSTLVLKVSTTNWHGESRMLRIEANVSHFLSSYLGFQVPAETGLGRGEGC